MSNAFITLWSQPQVAETRRSLQDSARLDHTANDQFRRVGVQAGDRVYVVAVAGGRLLLLGRIIVERVVDQDEAEKHFGGDVYEASDHLIGRGTPLALDRIVPESVARQIERASGKRIGIAHGAYVVDVHSLRATGRLTDASAALLDGLLDGPIVVDVDSVGIEEGGRRERRHVAIERSNAVRAAALAAHGTDCMACGFDFVAVYGELGAGFAEVHHLTPLSKLAGRTMVDPVADVAVLCANCHRMLHREDPPLAPGALARIIAGAH